MIPVNEPVVGERELALVSECVRSGWISSAGELIERFETQWAAYCDRRYGVAMSNGTAALLAAVRSVGLGHGDEVIVPTFTIISCALAVIEAGGTPIWIDADPRTWTMDVAQLESKIASRTRAIMPVHIYGHPVDMSPILRLAKKHGLVVIEDAAEAHGAEFLVDHEDNGGRWRRCGGFGDVSCFSFYANKIITTGEGGMVLTDDPKLAEELRSQRNLCFQPGRRFVHEKLGHNFRMTNLQAALGVAQLERIDAVVERKRAIGRQYNQAFRGMSAIQAANEMPWARSVYWMYGIVVDEETGMTASDLAAQLGHRGIDTRPFFLGMHEQPVIRRMGLAGKDAHPVATRLARQGLYLPSGLGLTDEQLQTVAATVREVLK